MPLVIGPGVSPYNAHKGTVLNPFDLSKIAFWQDTFDFAAGKLNDKSGNNNHFTLGNSYCVDPKGTTATASDLKTSITIDLTQPFTYTFEVFKNAAENAGIIFGGGHTFADYIWVTNTGLTFGNSIGNLIYAVSSVVGEWNRYEIVGNGTTITVTNINTNTSETKNTVATTHIIPSILGRLGGSSPIKHPVRFININNVSEWHFSEYPTNGTYASTYYDVIGGNHALARSWHVQTKADSKYHWNLKNGYSIWENGAGGIVWVPYGNDGNPLTLVVGTDIATGYAKTYDCPASLTHHNYCETGIKAPIELLPYDVDNYMFDVSDVAIDLLPEMIAENVGNQIFCNKSQVNKYYDLLVYKTPQS